MDRKKVFISVITFTVIIVLIVIILNLSSRYNSSFVNEDTWNRIIEGRTENKSMIFKDIAFNDYKLIIDDKNDILYYCIINESNDKYNPFVSYKSNKTDAKLAILSDEITDDKVKSNHEFKLMIYDDKEYHIYSLICTDLPILNISYNDNEKKKSEKIPMDFYLFNNLARTPNRVTISKGKFSINENGYAFSLYTVTPGKNKRDNKISILNMQPNSEYMLIDVPEGATHVDLMLKKEQSAEGELAELTDGVAELQKEEVAVEERNEKRNSCRVALFLNNEYQGIYLLENSEKKK